MIFDFFKKREIDYTKLPQHIGIIMDGNGRWAKRRGLPRSAGHSAGAKTLEKIVKECNKIGIKYITVYAFSTENWKRPKQEVDYLMDLLLDYLKNAEERLAGENVVIRAIGSRKELSEEIREQIAKTEDFTKNNTGIVMNIALNYGGREEILSSVKKIAESVRKGKVLTEDITEQFFEQQLYTAGQPDPDLLIRTSGEMRISNFLLWQIAYSEIWITNKLWPEFSVDDLMEAIYDYQHRKRRFGGV
ncbi:MAG: isoprenyl transferase [Clostridia bacterium]|nr:isoprenyl transferase [Clostridia bacterium]